MHVNTNKTNSAIVMGKTQFLTVNTGYKHHQYLCTLISHPVYYEKICEITITQTLMVSQYFVIIRHYNIACRVFYNINDRTKCLL